MLRDKEICDEALDMLSAEFSSGVTLKRTIEIINPHVDVERAIERERRAIARIVLRQMGCIPYKTDREFVYKPLSMLGAEHAADIQSRRIKPARTMVRNAVRIGLATSRQKSLFNDSDANATLTLELMQSEFERAAKEMAREIERIKGETVIETELEDVTPEREATR